LMGSSTNRNYTPVGRFFYILISMLHLFLNSETLVNTLLENKLLIEQTFLHDDKAFIEIL
jgi:hypothetical protein